MLNVCLRRNNCKSFSTWGFTDKYSWVYDEFGREYPNEAPLIMDPFYQPKLAYLALLDELDEHCDEVSLQAVDIYFVVDLSGSFGDDLPRFKSQAPGMMADIRESFPNSRFGLARFEDYPIGPFGSAGSGDTAYEQLIDLTFDTKAVNDIISGLSTRSGGDWPQCQLAALYQGASGAGQDLSGAGYPEASIPPGQQANFRDGSAKFFLLWTDAPFHEAGEPGDIPYPGPTAEETCDAILALDPPLVLGVSSGGGGLSDLQEIGAATNSLAPSGGVDCDGDGTIDIPEGEPLVCSIGASGVGIGKAATTLVKSAASLPIADADGPYTSSVGEVITFDGSGSSDSDGTIDTYEWDFQSDGVFDRSSAHPIATHIYTAEFSGTVTLRVTDSDANTSTDTAWVDVAGRYTVGGTTAPRKPGWALAPWIGLAALASLGLAVVGGTAVIVKRSS
jgi:hypothetical protein